MSETLGRWTFGLVFTGFNLTFFPMHLLGLMGMPRRIYTSSRNSPGRRSTSSSASAPASSPRASSSSSSTSSAASPAASGPAPNPWGGATLEWETTSPPPPYNFAHIPVVRTRDPLWDSTGEFPVAGGLRSDRRELVISSVVAAEPEARESSPRNSIWPLLAALTTTLLLIWSIFSPWAVV
jgi:cytochrome c oxidase subunit 1